MVRVLQCLANQSAVLGAQHVAAAAYSHLRQYRLPENRQVLIFRPHLFCFNLEVLTNCLFSWNVRALQHLHR